MQRNGQLRFHQGTQGWCNAVFSGQEHKGTCANTALKINFLSPNYQYSGNCSPNGQRQCSKAFQGGGASNQGLFSLLQLFLVHLPSIQTALCETVFNYTVLGTGQLLHAGKLGFAWKTVKRKCILKLKQWRTVFVASFCPYLKNTKL